MSYRLNSRSISMARIGWRLAVLVLALGLPQMATAQVVLSEIMADPASDWDGDGTYNYRDDEWVEVLNTGTETVDLAIYWLRDEATGEPRMNLSGLLAPGEVAVFYGSDALAWQAQSETGTGALALNNGGETVYLLEIGPGGYGDFTIVDTAVIADHEADDDRSGGLGVDHMTWLLFDGMSPYSGDDEPTGTGCAPSPGVPNTCDPLPVEHTRFGDLKASYR